MKFFSSLTLTWKLLFASKDEALQIIWRRVDSMGYGSLKFPKQLEVERIGSSASISCRGTRIRFYGPDFSNHWDETAWLIAEEIYYFLTKVSPTFPAHA